MCVWGGGGGGGTNSQRLELSGPSHKMEESMRGGCTSVSFGGGGGGGGGPGECISSHFETNFSIFYNLNFK